MKVLFTGFYGMRNFGDDLFAAACLRGTQNWPSATIAEILGPPIPEIDARYSCPRILASHFRRHDRLGAFLRSAIQAKAKSVADLVIYGGGSLFKDVRGTRVFSDHLARKQGANFAAIGVSLGPFASLEAEDRVRETLRRYSYLSVRDRASYNWATAQNFDFKVENAGDIVGVLPIDPIAVLNRDKLILGVSLARFAPLQLGDGSLPSRIYERLIQGIVQASKRDSLRVRVFELHVHERSADRELAQRLLHALRANGVSHELVSRATTGPLTLTRKIADCSSFISVRLHGAIVAYLSELPVVLVEHEKKCSEFLDDIGQPDLLRLGAMSDALERIDTAIWAVLHSFEKPSMDRLAYQRRSRDHFRRAPWALYHQEVK